MSSPQEFHYRLPRRFQGRRPGFHPGLEFGAGQEFVAHKSLYDWPDPRRLDLRASLQDVRRDWLVRVHRQRASIVIHAVVDVSASMQFGSTIPKLHVAAEFVESLAQSAQRIGDAVGMLAFDGIERTDLFFPASLRRGVGPVMANRLRACTGGPGSPAALEATAMRLSGRPGIIFLISDFHWPLDRLSATLDMLSQAYVVPLVIWDRVEIQPPAQSGPLQVRDAESAAQRTLWVRAGLRNAWRRAVAARREALNGIFRSRDIRPFYIEERFDGEALSQYFLEAHA